MANLSPVYMWQSFINGIPANGAQLFTYAAGSTTKIPTYTDDTGITSNPNPIILDSRGEPPDSIWLAEGQAYDFVFTSPTDIDPPTSPIRTVQNVVGIGTVAVSLSQWVDSGFTPTYIDANTFTVLGDQTSTFTVNRRIKATVTGGTVYGYISNVSFGSGVTTVDVVLDSGALDIGLSSVQLGIITPENTSLPKIPNFVNDIMMPDDLITPRMLSPDVITPEALADSTFGISMMNGYITASVAGNALTVAIKTKAGTDPSPTNPIVVEMRDTSPNVGTFTILNITAALSITVPSGATLGTVSGQTSRLYVSLFNNAGTPVLGLINLSTYIPYGDDTTANGTLISGASNSAGAHYTTATVAAKALKVLGFVQSTQATAGTWASAPAIIANESGVYFAKEINYSTNLTSFSAPYTPAAGETLSRPHGLTATIPTVATLVLECVVADAGYSVGDRVCPVSQTDLASFATFNPYSDATNCGVKCLAGLRVYITNKTTGAAAYPTANAWRYAFEYSYRQI